jgi:hypothetical protein
VEERDESPIEAALELCVYAPLGFALEARSLLPRFVERGRNQVAMARVVGKFAVEKGREDLGGRVADGQATVVGLLRLAGVVGPEADGGQPSGPTPRPGAPVVAAVPDLSTPPDGTDAEATTGPVPDGPGADTLAIPGYESLSASQVVPRLDSLTEAELEEVRRYEQAHRGRKTILNKILQLQTA